MRIIKDYGLVRVISTGLDPRETGYNIIVEYGDLDTDTWQFYCGFNSFTDDSAYTHAFEAARRAIKEIARDKANAI